MGKTQLLKIYNAHIYAPVIKNSHSKIIKKFKRNPFKLANTTINLEITICKLCNV